MFTVNAHIVFLTSQRWGSNRDLRTVSLRRRLGVGLLTKWLLHTRNNHPSVLSYACLSHILGCAGVFKQEYLPVGGRGCTILGTCLKLGCHSSVVQGTSYLCCVKCLFLPPYMHFLKSRRLSRQNLWFYLLAKGKIKSQRAKTWIFFMSVIKASLPTTFFSAVFSLILYLSW